MSGAALIDGIGVISGVLGIVGFLQDQIPEPPMPSGAAVRIKVGVSKGDEEGQLDGDLAAVYAWGVDNNFLGQGGGQYISEGDAPTIIVNQDSAGKRAEYVGISADKNALCIAWITVAQTDGTQGSSWIGDLGFGCGHDWYPSAEFAGYIDKNGPREPSNQYVPNCAWLDGDHSNGLEDAALKFRTLAYDEEAVETFNNGAACSATIWGPETGPIQGQPAGKRAANKPRQQWMQERLIVSNLTQHSAKEVCESVTSWGPDFVSEHEGQFCDMETKTLAPLCSALDIDGCLNIDPVANKVTKRTIIAKRAVELAHKSYEKTTLWGH